MPEIMQRLAAERTRKGAANLVLLLLATPSDKLRWKPLGLGRSVMEVVIECILVNRKWALTLRQGVYTRLSAETIVQIETAGRDVIQAAQMLQESADELAAAILTLTPEQLEGQITAPFGAYLVG